MVIIYDYYLVNKHICIVLLLYMEQVSSYLQSKFM